jgi:hypothetical protein
MQRNFRENVNLIRGAAERGELEGSLAFNLNMGLEDMHKLLTDLQMAQNQQLRAIAELGSQIALLRQRA